MKVLLLSRYGRLGASSRLRAHQYLRYLTAHGFQITTSPLFGDYYQGDMQAGRSRSSGKVTQDYLQRLLRLAQAPTFDLVWTEYELFPWLPAFAERLLSGLRIPYVVEYDDPIYHRYELHPSRAVRLLLGKKVDVIMQQADTVIVGNSYLGERAQRAGARRLEYLPTVVDLDRYPVRPPRAKNTLTIGWIGSPSTARYLSLIKPALADFCRDHDARVVVVGAHSVDLEGVPIEIRPWSEDGEVEDILSFDVGIMPLPDEPWERGKCGYKLIQYMASARPVIASPVGVNREIVEPGVNGFLATTHEEWRAALETLYLAPELRTRMGAAGRRKVEASYCTRVTAPLLAGILKRAPTADGTTP